MSVEARRKRVEELWRQLPPSVREALLLLAGLGDSSSKDADPLEVFRRLSWYFSEVEPVLSGGRPVLMALNHPKTALVVVELADKDEAVKKAEEVFRELDWELQELNRLDRNVWYPRLADTYTREALASILENLKDEYNYRATLSLEGLARLENLRRKHPTDLVLVGLREGRAALHIGFSVYTEDGFRPEAAVALFPAAVKEQVNPGDKIFVLAEDVNFSKEPWSYLRRAVEPEAEVVFGSRHASGIDDAALASFSFKPRSDRFRRIHLVVAPKILDSRVVEIYPSRVRRLLPVYDELGGSRVSVRVPLEWFTREGLREYAVEIPAGRRKLKAVVFVQADRKTREKILRGALSKDEWREYQRYIEERWFIGAEDIVRGKEVTLELDFSTHRAYASGALVGTFAPVPPEEEPEPAPVEQKVTERREEPAPREPAPKEPKKEEPVKEEPKRRVRFTPNLEAALSSLRALSPRLAAEAEGLVARLKEGVPPGRLSAQERRLLLLLRALASTASATADVARTSKRKPRRLTGLGWRGDVPGVDTASEARLLRALVRAVKRGDAGTLESLVLEGKRRKRRVES